MMRQSWIILNKKNFFDVCNKFRRRISYAQVELNNDLYV